MSKNEDLKNKVKDLLTKLGLTKPVKLAAHALADGATVYTEAEAPAVGDAVYADEAMTEPVADGSYTLESGVTLVVEAGVILEMVEAPADDAEMQEMVETMSAALETATTENTNLKATVAKLQAEVAKQTKLATELATKLKAVKPGSVTEVKAEASDPIRMNKHLFGKTTQDLSQFKINEN
jgi:hypothetical protein